MYRPASPTPFTHRVVVNPVLYKSSGWPAPWAPPAGMPGLGTLTVLAVILWHLAEVVRPLDASGLIVLTGLLGGIWDSLLVNLSLIHYPSGTTHPSSAHHRNRHAVHPPSGGSASPSVNRTTVSFR